jgi:hypothetical protein
MFLSPDPSRKRILKVFEEIRMSEFKSRQNQMPETIAKHCRELELERFPELVRSCPKVDRAGGGIAGFRRTRFRRGVTLLFVVSLIVLFLLMGTAFVVLSTDFFRSARKRAYHDLHVIDGEAYLDKAFYDLVREPDLHDSTSPLRGHSLLGDMYGYGFKARIGNAQLHGSQQFIVLQLDLSSARHVLDDSPVIPPKITQWAGLVLTVTSGDSQGLSSRIVDHQVLDTLGQILLIQPDWRNTSLQPSQVSFLNGAEVVINGRPFAGTGAGRFDAQQPANRAAFNASSLQPNQSGRSRDDLIGRNGEVSSDGQLLGYLSSKTVSGLLVPNHSSTNESYDSFDYQNQFLAGVKADGSIAYPSFHRQELINQFPIRSDFRAIRGPNQGLLVDNLNNGSPDGVWIDIGLSTLSDREGTRFKPLVSYTVIDLDSKINLNAHGNAFAADRQMTEIGFLTTRGLGQPDPESLQRGVGYGPPEIKLQPTLVNSDWVLTGNGLIPGRYGADGKPGEADARDGWASYKLFGYPDRSFLDPIPGTVSGDFGSAMDAHGRFAVGYPDDTKDFGVPVHLPVANVGISNLTSELVDSAFEMSFSDYAMTGPQNKFDSPYTLQELEAVLRSSDIDSRLLPNRLRELGAAEFSGLNDSTHAITTSSFEVPTRMKNLPEQLSQILARYNPALTAAEMRDQIQVMLPSEIIRGLPMNLNRPFGDGVDNNGDSVVDESGETNQITHPNGQTYTFNQPFARYHLARHLYVLALLATEKFDTFHAVIPQSILDYRRRVAQWAINVIDFRDRDAIMTGFEVDLNPWDGWDVDGDLLTTDMLNGRNPANRAVYWGVERPELLISEVVGTHVRATQDLDIDPSGKRVDDDPDPDEDFDSHLAPRASVFFELYNPWIVNEANQFRPAELYDSRLDGVDLQKQSIDGTPVWRMVVTAPNAVANQGDDDPDDPANSVSFQRRIYFVQPIDDAGPEVYFPANEIRVPSVQPGFYAVVGSAGVKKGDQYSTYFGRKGAVDPVSDEELASTRQITLNPRRSQLKLVTWNFQRQQMETLTREKVVNIPIGLNDGGFERSLGVSDPVAGYGTQQHNGQPVMMVPIADGHKFTIDLPTTGTDFAFDLPIDKLIDETHFDQFLKVDGLHTGYRTVHLQRLANPLAPYDSQLNPYLTIDSSAIDLVVFNGIESKEDPNNSPADLRFGSYERRGVIDADGNSTQPINENRHRLLFKHGRQGTQFQNAGGLQNFPTGNQIDRPIGQDRHLFSHNLKESLGSINHAYRNAKEIAADAEQFPFAWLTWNNRPFASHLELVNVPFTNSYRLTRLFDVADEQRDVYQTGSTNISGREVDQYSGHYPHLLNFYLDDTGVPQLEAGLHRVFDFVDVPSRFLGTESYLNPEVFRNDQGLSFNLAAPFDTISNFRYPGKININTILDERVWNSLMGNYGTPMGGGTAVTFSDWEDSRNGSGLLPFGNPLRSPQAGNWVPLNGLRSSPADCGLFRRSTVSAAPLFDYRSTAMHNNTQRAAYFRYDCRQRLGNLVTGRSSVFAIWITVGYFEVDASGSIILADQGGRELGSETGEVKRHRAFFIFDRSIPVAFEPGRNHNVDRAVMIRRRLD